MNVHLQRMSPTISVINILYNGKANFLELSEGSAKPLGNIWTN